MALINMCLNFQTYVKHFLEIANAVAEPIILLVRQVISKLEI